MLSGSPLPSTEPRHTRTIAVFSNSPREQLLVNFLTVLGV
jgi:hypothetical protein